MGGRGGITFGRSRLHRQRKIWIRCFVDASMDSTKGVPSLWQRLTTSQQRYRNLQHMCPHVERLQVRRKQNPQGKRPWIQRSSDGALIWHAATQLTLKPGRQVFFTTQTSKLTDVKLRYAKRLPDPVMKLELIFFFLSTWLNLFNNTRSSCPSSRPHRLPWRGRWRRWPDSNPRPSVNSFLWYSLQPAFPRPE